MTKFSTSGFVHPVLIDAMCVKDEKEDVTRSERVRERNKNGNASRFRERDGEKEDEKSYHFHVIVSKIQTRDESPKTNIIIITTNACKQRERKKEHI